MPVRRHPYCLLEALFKIQQKISIEQKKHTMLFTGSHTNHNRPTAGETD